MLNCAQDQALPATASMHENRKTTVGTGQLFYLPKSLISSASLSLLKIGKLCGTPL